MSEWSSPAGERVKGALVGFLGGALWAGLLAWSIVQESTKPAPPPADPTLVERVTALEARADAQAKIRCLNVTTDRMDMAIFPVENVGKKKVEGR